MKNPRRKIFAASIALLTVAASIALAAHCFSTGFISIGAPSNHDLIDTPTARSRPTADTLAPAFHVPLALVPGAAKFPAVASIGPIGSKPSPLQIVQLAQGSRQSPALPEPIQISATTHSNLEIALHPSLKYASWVPSAVVALPSNAAIDVRTVALGESTAAPAKLSHPAGKPMATLPGETQMAQLIALNLKMEEDRRFVMSICEDKQGCLWVGTAGAGVERFDPSAPELRQWTRFTTKDGLGDNNGYAIACDCLGRTWGWAPQSRGERL